MQAHAKTVIHKLGTCTLFFLPCDVSSPVSSPPVDFVCRAASKTFSITMEGPQGCGASGGSDPPPVSSRLLGPGDPTHDTTLSSEEVNPTAEPRSFTRSG